MTLAELTVKILGNADGLTKAMKQAEGSAKESLGGINAMATKFGIGMMGVGTGLGLLANNMIQSAKKAEVLETRLKMMGLSGEQAAQRLNELRELTKVATKFELQDFVDADIILKQFKVDSEALLPAIAGLAERLNIDLRGASQIVGRAMAGDSRSMQMLARQFNINTKTLQEFDSAYDKTGKDVVKNSQIMSRYLIQTFGKDFKLIGDTAESMAGDWKVEMEKFQSSIGKTMLPAFKDLMQNLTALMQKFNELSPAVKGTVGQLLLVAPPIFIATGFLTTFIVQLKTAGIVTGGLTTAIGGSTAGFAAFAGAIGLAVIAGLALNAYLENQIKLFEDQAKAIQESNKEFRAYRDLVGGKLKSEDIELAKKQLQELINLTEKEVEERSNMLIWLTSEEIMHANRREDLAKAHQERIKETNRLYKLSGDRLDILRKKMEDLGKVKKEPVAKEFKIPEATEMKVFDWKEIEEGFSEGLKLSMDYIAKKKAMNELSAEDEIKAIKRILQEATLTTEKRKQKELELLGLETTVRQDKISRAKSLKDEMNQLTLDEYNYAKAKMKDRADEMKKEGYAEVDIKKWVVAQTKKIEDDKVKREKDKADNIIKIAKDLTDEINKINMTADQYEAWSIKKRVDELREQHVPEVKIAEWVTAKRKEYLKEDTDNVKKAIEDQKAEYDSLISKMKSLKEQRLGGAASPLMGLEEVGLSSVAQFTKPTGAGAGGESTGAGATKPSLPSVSDLISGTKPNWQKELNPWIDQPVKENYPKGDMNYTVNIAGITVEGEKAKKLFNDLVNITGDINRTESLGFGVIGDSLT